MLPEPRLNLSAFSICIYQKEASITEDSTHEMVIILFQPTAFTLEYIQSIHPGTQFSAIDLNDKWDDGSDDVHYNNRMFEFISATPQAGQKLHTWIVKVKPLY